MSVATSVGMSGAVKLVETWAETSGDLTSVEPNLGW